MFDCSLMVERQGRQIGSVDELLTKQVSANEPFYIKRKLFNMAVFTRKGDFMKVLCPNSPV